ncbi:2-alkenal reductase, partial [Klebsiella pneumoniae]|nr:2-alkenal reductase [Klebsiella pneumoniae]
MENDVTYPTPTAARRWLVITGCIAALMLLWQFLPAIEAWFSPH